jgi:hypothetical protein
MRTKLVVLLTFLFSAAYSQARETSQNLWLSGGLGFNVSSYLGGFSTFSSLNWSRSGNVIRNDILRHRSFLVESRYLKHIGFGDEDNHSNINEFDLLSGISFGEAFQFRISAGVGLINGTKNTGYNPPGTPVYGEGKISKFGFPIELGINLIPDKYFGLGIKGFANINPELSFYGAILNFEIGKIYGTRRIPIQDTSSFTSNYKTCIGFKGAVPSSIGVSAKHFLKGNKAIEGIISTRNLSKVYTLLCLTLLFEDEKILGTEQGNNWFWGAGIHGGYGFKNTDNPYYSGYEKNTSKIGFDAIIGIEHTFENSPFNFSLDIIQSLDLYFNPWTSAAISVRYAFK